MLRKVPFNIPSLSQAFENKDYSTSPATYEQTNARASHILVDTEEQANEIKAKLEAGTLDFAGAALPRLPE